MATIRRVLNAETVDVDTLRQLAISRGGLLSDDLRLQAWPKLLSVDVSNISPKPRKQLYLMMNLKLLNAGSSDPQHFKVRALQIKRVSFVIKK